MKIAALNAVMTEVISMVGKPKDCKVQRGGDLSVSPTDLNQQENLLTISALLERPVKCSLPTSSTSFKGVVRLPDESIEDIKTALAGQNVKDAHRPIRPDGTQSGIVVLTFSTRIPSSVKIACMNYEVRQFIPNPFRCRQCWRLGHTQTHCNSKTVACKKCGTAHDLSGTCRPKCVNCGLENHEADSTTCPAYIEAKNTIKMAVLENISVKEARIRMRRAYSAVTKSTVPNPESHGDRHRERSGESAEMALLKSQMANLQNEMEMLKWSTIPKMEKSINEVSTEVKETKTLLNSQFGQLNCKLDAFINKISNLPALSTPQVTGAQQKTSCPQLAMVDSRLVLMEAPSPSTYMNSPDPPPWSDNEQVNGTY